MSLQDFTQNGVPSPNSTESYQDYMVRLDLLGHGFSYSELVNRLSFKKQLPPRSLWHRMAMTLAFANELRFRCRVDGSANGLKVAATYRPLGGAANSQHKRNAAIDLDRIGGDAEGYFETATRLWCDWGHKEDLGLGLYTWGSGSTGGIRVHLDTGYHTRTWQGVRASFKKPWLIEGRRSPLAIKLAYDMGLDVPTRDDI